MNISIVSVFINLSKPGLISLTIQMHIIKPKTNLVSNPLTIAPMALAEPAAANPATPPPMINTYSHTHEMEFKHVKSCIHTLKLQQKKPTHTHTHTTHLCRWHFPSCCDLSSEKTTKAVCCQHNSLVPEMTERHIIILI